MPVLVPVSVPVPAGVASALVLFRLPEPSKKSPSGVATRFATERAGGEVGLVVAGGEGCNNVESSLLASRAGVVTDSAAVIVMNAPWLRAWRGCAKTDKK
jgi:hypothetical protein